MFKKYFGDKKKEIVEKKINNQDGYKLVVTCWIDDVLTKKEEFFENLEDTMCVCDDKFGTVKIYDRENKLVHSQKNKEKRGKGHYQHGQGHGHGHDHHDHDLYA